MNLPRIFITLMLIFYVYQNSFSQTDDFYIKPTLEADRLSFILGSDGIMLLRKDNDWSLIDPKGQLLHTQPTRPFLIKAYDNGAFISIGDNFVSRKGENHSQGYRHKYVDKENDLQNKKRVKEFNKILKRTDKKLKARYKNGACVFYFGRQEIFRFPEFLYHYYYKVEVLNNRFLYFETGTKTQSVKRDHKYFDLKENKILSSTYPKYLASKYKYHILSSGKKRSLYSSDLTQEIYSNDTCAFRFIDEETLLLLPRKKKKHMLDLATLQIDKSKYKVHLDATNNILIAYETHYIRIKNDTSYKANFTIKGYLSKGHYVGSSDDKLAVVDINNDRPITEFKYETIKRVSKNAAIGMFYDKDSTKVYDILNNKYSIVESGQHLELKNIRNDILQVINRKDNSTRIYAQTGPAIYSGPNEKVTYHRGFIRIGKEQFCKYELSDNKYIKTFCYDHIEDKDWSDNNELREVDLILAKNEGLWGVIDLDGNPLSSFSYDEISASSDKDRMIINKNGLWGVLKITNL